MKLINN